MRILEPPLIPTMAMTELPCPFDAQRHKAFVVDERLQVNDSVETAVVVPFVAFGRYARVEEDNDGESYQRTSVSEDGREQQIVLERSQDLNGCLDLSKSVQCERTFPFLEQELMASMSRQISLLPYPIPAPPTFRPISVGSR